jgi:hypothetical protein
VDITNRTEVVEITERIAMTPLEKELHATRRLVYQAEMVRTNRWYQEHELKTKSV